MILLMLQKSGVHQLRLVVCPVIYRVLYLPGGAGFLAYGNNFNSDVSPFVIHSPFSTFCFFERLEKKTTLTRLIKTSGVKYHLLPVCLLLVFAGVFFCLWFQCGQPPPVSASDWCEKPSFSRFGGTVQLSTRTFKIHAQTCNSRQSRTLKQTWIPTENAHIFQSTFTIFLKPGATTSPYAACHHLIVMCNSSRDWIIDRILPKHGG